MGPGLFPEPETAWTRVVAGPCSCHAPAQVHDRWEIKNPHGDGKDYLCTDEVIRTYGRAHVAGHILAGLPPLPESAWEGPLLNQQQREATAEHRTGPP